MLKVVVSPLGYDIGIKLHPRTELDFFFRSLEHKQLWDGPIEIKEIVDAIDRLKTNKALGFDDLSTELY